METKHIIKYLKGIIKHDKELSKETIIVLKEIIKKLNKACTVEDLIKIIAFITALFELSEKIFHT